MLGFDIGAGLLLNSTGVDDMRNNTNDSAREVTSDLLASDHVAVRDACLPPGPRDRCPESPSVKHVMDM